MHLVEEGADDGRAVRACTRPCCHGNWCSHSPARGCGCSRSSAADDAKLTVQSFSVKAYLWNAAFCILSLDQSLAANRSLVHKTSRSCPAKQWSSSMSQAFSPREQSKNRSWTHKCIGAFMQDKLLASQWLDSDKISPVFLCFSLFILQRTQLSSLFIAILQMSSLGVELILNCRFHCWQITYCSYVCWCHVQVFLPSTSGKSVWNTDNDFFNMLQEKITSLKKNC